VKKAKLAIEKEEQEEKERQELIRQWKESNMAVLCANNLCSLRPYMEKSSGCNKMTCPKCNLYTCFICE
jgi:oligoribonuclease (3'-5' exoribonuclease)